MAWEFLRIVTDIPESIGIIFQKIGTFLDGTVLVFLNIYVLFVIVLFFLILAFLMYIPIKLYPMYKQNKQLIDKIIKLDYE